VKLGWIYGLDALGCTSGYDTDDALHLFYPDPKHTKWLTLLREVVVDLDVDVETEVVEEEDLVEEVARMRRRSGTLIVVKFNLTQLLLTSNHRAPVTKLGRLVKDGKIKSMEEIYLFSLPVKEYQIVDFFLPKLKDEVMKIMPVQKQTRAGQRTRFKAFVAIGDFEGHVGLGVKCAKEVATAIRGAIILAKLSVIPVRRGYWGAALGEPHTVPSKVSGKVGSVMCRLIPAPRGTGIVAAPASKRLLQLAGVEDVYTQSKGSTATMGNFLKATFVAVCALLFEFRMSPDQMVCSDYKNIWLHYTGSVARDPSFKTAIRRIQWSPGSHEQEGILDVVSLLTRHVVLSFHIEYFLSTEIQSLLSILGNCLK